eukprot:CAMPEP_0197682204 /NCGR_PEP_ID=MMETSP1338-20131121/96140_1 /TAXON_ID=43686 ORGANISM="Pelagodinium beii, Strain RCC1491" /NCGR_SAMPLE_ID=MMETSP1338 /ASSEMBLY_ACC=CAM_ASM_000754 /LENGTH=286 /DNA_ID=CAMNT_0043263645 /DNA_START=18 /DNA_END=875 /DNA_ORIENTATION=+
MPTGDKYVCVSTTSGTPFDAFLGVSPPSGRSFHFMAIDIHWVVDAKIKETWHLEELRSAVKQLKGKTTKKEIPLFHHGQMGNFEKLMQREAGSQIKGSELPQCVKDYYKAINHAEDFDMTEALAGSICDKAWEMHPNECPGLEGKPGPGCKVWADSLDAFWKEQFKWELRVALRVPCSRACEKYVVLSEVSGLTKGEFLGLALEEAKSFCIMGIDIHTVKRGKIIETWHIEDWASATEQLQAGGSTELHSGQPLNPDAGMQAPKKEEKEEAKKEEAEEKREEVKSE